MFEHSLEVPGLHDSLLSTILTLQFEYHLTIYCLCFTLKPPGPPSTRAAVSTVRYV